MTVRSTQLPPAGPRNTAPTFGATDVTLLTDIIETIGAICQIVERFRPGTGGAA